MGGSWRKTGSLLAPALLGVWGRETDRWRGARLSPPWVPWAQPLPQDRLCEPGKPGERSSRAPGAEAEQDP